ncbi:hypothetical protein Tco_1251332 [Tanacetum coccineum]
MMSNLLQVPYDATVRLLMASLEHNLLPDAVTRRLTRMLLAGRLRSCFKPTSQQQLQDLMAFVHCTGYSLKDKNKAKPDKTKSRIGKSAKNRGQSQDEVKVNPGIRRWKEH